MVNRNRKLSFASHVLTPGNPVYVGDALATCSYDGTWRLWDVATGTALLEQEGHSRAVYSIAFHPDGSLCGSGGFDAASRIWDCRTGRNVLTFQGHTYGILSMAFSPNGYHVATGAPSAAACCCIRAVCVSERVQLMAGEWVQVLGQHGIIFECAVLALNAVHMV